MNEIVLTALLLKGRYDDAFLEALKKHNITLEPISFLKQLPRKSQESDLCIVDSSLITSHVHFSEIITPLIIVDKGNDFSIQTSGIIQTIPASCDPDELARVSRYLLRKRKVVIVDDSPNFRQMISDEFDEKDFEKHFAVNGLEGYQLAKKVKPDLITMDVEMPVMDGYKATRMIREDKETENIPVIFATTLGKEEDINRGYNAGGIDYFIKPFPKGTLKKYTQNLLNRMESRNIIEVAIIDEHKNSLKIMEHIFNKNGFSSVTINRIKDIDPALKNHDPALIVLNIDTEDVSFESVIKSVVLMNDETPVIAVTENDSKAKIVRALKSGAVDYVHAPFVEEEIIARVEAHLKISSLMKDMKSMNEKLQELSVTDPLTKLYNRGYLTKSLMTEIKKLSRKKSWLSCILLDIDFFKKVNDTYGHIFGDFVLVKMAELLQEVPRETDIVARYGGEEFIILLPHTSVEGARTLAEKIRHTVEKKDFDNGDVSIRLTISCGVYGIQNFLEGKTLVKYADDALYQAKEMGRNRVICYENI